MKPTVLIVSQAVLAIGGIESYIEQLARGMRDAFRFVVAGPITPPFEAAMASTGASLRMLSRHGKLHLDTLRSLDALITEFRPSILLAVEPRSRLMSHPVAWFRGVPALVTLEITTDAYGLRPAAARFYRAVEGLYDRTVTRHVIYVSEYDRQRGPTPATRSTTIHNSVDVDAFAPLLSHQASLRHEIRAELGIDDSRPIVVTVGRMAYQKAPEILIDAIALVRDRLAAPFTVVWVGDGEERAAIQARAAAHGLGDIFRMVGSQPVAGVRRWLVGSDVFVLASHFECFPLSILEACAAGLPCIVTDVGGNREAITDGVNGRVVPPKSPSALAEALVKVLSSPERRADMGLSARDTAQWFSTPRMLAATEALLRHHISYPLTDLFSDAPR